MPISEITHLTDEVVQAFARLIPQLSSAPPPGPTELEQIITSEAAHILAHRTPDGEINGLLTLVVFRVPTGLRAWIEDVVVNENARGQGIGEALTRAALNQARTLGAHSIELTSRPSREAANRLYQRLGFQKRSTNLYHLQL
jgi:ribosomal protein S18 acetylase RimI-like enzyme